MNKYSSVLKVSIPAEQEIRCQKMNSSSTWYNHGRYSQLNGDKTIPNNPHSFSLT